MPKRKYPRYKTRTEFATKSVGQVVEELQSYYPALTFQEAQVLIMCAIGEPLERIAEIQETQTSKIRAQLTRLYKRLGFERNSRVEAAFILGAILGGRVEVEAITDGPG